MDVFFRIIYISNNRDAELEIVFRACNDVGRARVAAARMAAALDPHYSMDARTKDVWNRVVIEGQRVPPFQVKD